MEELQTTEILDREILEDARKKAYRILKTADETIQAKAGEWEKKIGRSLEELGKKYEEQRKVTAREIMARLPMDKRRAKAEKIEGLLRRAVDAWYAGLDRGRIISLLGAELVGRVADCGEFTECGESAGRGHSAEGSAPRALIHKLEKAEAEGILRTALPGGTCAVVEMPSAAPYPELVLENGAVRITASINRAVDFFLHARRGELVEALLGKAVLGDDFTGGVA